MKATHIKVGDMSSRSMGETDMKSIITISREFGACGGTIGRLVAEELGYYYFDKDMVIQAATESKILTPEEVRRYDEIVPKSIGFGQGLFDFYHKPLDQKLFAAQKEVIRKVASKGKCVIVGRNSNDILQQYDHSLHVFISATKYFRLQHLKEIMPDATLDQIEDKMRYVDRTRKKYCSYYTNTEFGNSDYYDLCLKSSTLGVDKCVEIICKVAREED